MNAIELLEQQHKDVDALFDAADEAEGDAKEEVFAEIGDALAMHATLEEKVFYPAVKAARTEDILLESLEEHLAIKRVLSDMLDLPATDPTFEPKLKVLREQVEHHVEEERTELFPKVKKLFDAARLEQLGAAMEELAKRIEGTEPRFHVRLETGDAAPLT